MKNNLKYLGLAFLLQMAIACENQQAEGEEADHHEQESLKVSLLEENGFALGEIQKLPLQKSFTVMGMVEAPPQSTAQVYPTIGAFVEKVFVIKGQEVVRGEKLAVLRHPDILDFQQRYLAAKNELEQFQADYLRKQKLLEENAISNREFQATKARFLSVQSETQSLASTLRSMSINPKNLSEGNVQETVLLKAPIGGHVLSTRAAIGQLAGRSEPLFTIVSKDHLHLELQVPPSKINWVKTGQKVRFKTASGERNLNGDIYLVNQVADEQGFFNVHAHFHDSLKKMHPGNYAEAQIIYFNDSAYVLPATAVGMMEGKPHIIVRDGKILKERLVATGNRSDSLVEIIDAQQLLGKEIVLNGTKYLLARDREGGHSH